MTIVESTLPIVCPDCDERNKKGAKECTGCGCDQLPKIDEQRAADASAKFDPSKRVTVKKTRRCQNHITIYEQSAPGGPLHKSRMSVDAAVRAARDGMAAGASATDSATAAAAAMMEESAGVDWDVLLSLGFNPDKKFTIKAAAELCAPAVCFPLPLHSFSFSLSALFVIGAEPTMSLRV